MPMSDFNRELPPLLHERLQKWYRISSYTLLCLLCVLSTIHIYTIMRFYSMKRILYAQKDMVNSPSTALSSQVKERVDSYKKAHEHLYQLLQAFLSDIPRDAYLTHVTIEPYKYLLCEGICLRSAVVGDLIELLKNSDYTTIVQLVVAKHELHNVSFTLRVSHVSM